MRADLRADGRLSKHQRLARPAFSTSFRASQEKEDVQKTGLPVLVLLAPSSQQETTNKPARKMQLIAALQYRPAAKFAALSIPDARLRLGDGVNATAATATFRSRRVSPYYQVPDHRLIDGR